MSQPNLLKATSKLEDQQWDACLTPHPRVWRLLFADRNYRYIYTHQLKQGAAWSTFWTPDWEPLLYQHNPLLLLRWLGLASQLLLQCDNYKLVCWCAYEWAVWMYCVELSAINSLILLLITALLRKRCSCKYGLWARSSSNLILSQGKENFQHIHCNPGTPKSM